MTTSSTFRRCSLMCLPLLGVLTAAAGWGAELSDEDRQAIEAAIAAVKPALVRIHVASTDYQQGREVKMETFGSGAIISKDGYVVTNHHVAGRAKRLVCTLASKEEAEADLVGTDPLADLAVIKLRPTPGREFPTAGWGDSSELRVGDRVMAMGSPEALSQSVTLGIVSNTEMIMPEFAEGEVTLEGEDVGSLVRWIGHDAAIYPGNSGGPLVNVKGQIVGVNEISVGLGGAIPASLARQVAEQIIKLGKVQRAWIGIGVQPLLEGSAQDRGVLVNGALPGSPGAAAGFKCGDILIKLAGNDISVRYQEQIPIFNQMVASLPIGQEVEAVILRDGKEETLKVTTKDRPEAQFLPHEFRAWGICASNISFVKAREMKRARQDGVLVRSVRPGGPSDEAKPSLEEDDVIAAVDGKPVKDVADLMAATANITKGKTEPTPVLVSFERKPEKLITVVKVGTKESEDPGREVRKAYLPIASQVLTQDIAEALGVRDRTGVRVTQVFPASAAEKAGLKVGDLIVALDGDEIPASQPEDTEVLPAMIRQYKIGSTVQLTVLRDKKEVRIPVVLPESPLLAREMRKYRDDNFEFTCRDLAAQDRIEKKLEKDVIGVYVEEVTEGGWASLGHLSSGDVIRSADGKPVADVTVFRQVMQKIAAEKPKHVVFRVQRGAEEEFVELETDWSK